MKKNKVNYPSVNTINTEDGEFTLIHEEAGMDKDSDSYLSHHFHLHHGDNVEVKVTATNNAEKSTSATSDGYIVDLTEPSMLALVDGVDVARDIHYTVSVKPTDHSAIEIMCDELQTGSTVLQVKSEAGVCDRPTFRILSFLATFPKKWAKMSPLLL